MSNCTSGSSSVLRSEGRREVLVRRRKLMIDVPVLFPLGS
jgi:hypothetical protein